MRRHHEQRHFMLLRMQSDLLASLRQPSMPPLEGIILHPATRPMIAPLPLPLPSLASR
jgi:hypothetical protein